MVNPRIRTFPWIIIIVVILVLVQLVDCKKHRASHSQPHQRHHRKPHAKIRHHQHHHLPLIKKFSRSITTNNPNVSSNMTKILRSTNSPVNQSTTLLPPRSNFSNTENMKSAFIDTWNRSIYMGSHDTNFHPREASNISIKQDFKSTDFSTIRNSTTDVNVISSFGQFDNISNVFPAIAQVRDSTSFSFSSTSPSTLESIVDTREEIANFLSFRNRTVDDDLEDSTSNRTLEPTNITNESVATRALDSTVIDENEKLPKKETKEIATEFRFVTNIQNLGNADDIETVTHQSNSSTKDNMTTYKRGKFVKELEQLFGPTEEPKDFTNIDTPLVGLIRRKRSNEAENGEEEAEEKPKKRTLLDFNGPDTSEETENFEDSSNVVHKRVKRNDPMDFDENPYALNPNYLQDLEDSFAPSALEVQAQKTDDEMAQKSKLLHDNPQLSGDQLRLKRDTNHANYEGNYENDPKIEMKQNIGSNEQQPEQKDVSTDSSTPSPEDFSHTGGSTPKKDFIGMNSSEITSLGSVQLASSKTQDEEGRQNREDREFSNEGKSAADDGYLQDDNRVSRNGLNDVYPDSIEDPQPEAMVPLVRTKRFGESFVYPESSDLSYANEQPDSSKLVPDEPYAEDNKIIDSMLNKVVGRSAEEGKNAEYSKLENDADQKSEVSFRDKRDTERLTRRKRRFGGNRKHKKHRRRKKKKKNRHRTGGYEKRASLLSDREYRKEVAQSERDASKEDQDHFHEIYEQDVISPHDGRRRRDYEDETNDNLHYNINEPALGQVEREPRESDAFQKNPSGDDIRRNAKERDGTVDDNASREKRGTRKDEDANGTSQITDKNLIGPKLAEPIRDIKELVEKLLVKVNELAGYVYDASPDAAPTKNSRCAKTIAQSISQTSRAPKTIQESNIAVKPASKPVNSMRRQKACWKSSTSDRHPPKNRRPSKSIGVDCEKRIRRKRKPGRKWDRWTDWSSCSVTCGKGRQIRWRHCLRNCSTAETEMEEKACQFPACAPGKFLGIFG